MGFKGTRNKQHQKSEQFENRQQFNFDNSESEDTSHQNIEKLSSINIVIKDTPKQSV